MPNRLLSNVVLMDTRIINVDVEITYITKRETIEDIILPNWAHYHTYTTKQYCIYLTPRHTKQLMQRPYWARYDVRMFWSRGEDLLSVLRREMYDSTTDY